MIRDVIFVVIIGVWISLFDWWKYKPSTNIGGGILSAALLLGLLRLLAWLVGP